MRASTLPRSLFTSTVAPVTCYASEKPSMVTAIVDSVRSPPGIVLSWSMRLIPV